MEQAGRSRRHRARWHTPRQAVAQMARVVVILVDLANTDPALFPLGKASRRIRPADRARYRFARELILPRAGEGSGGHSPSRP